MQPTRPRFEVTNQSKGSSVKLKANQIHIAKVVRDSGGVFVNVPTLSPNQVFGPCQVFSKRPRTGDFVLVGFVEGKRSNLVVLGSASSNYRLVEVDNPQNPQDAATKKYVDDEILELKTFLQNWVTANFSSSSHGH